MLVRRIAVHVIFLAVAIAASAQTKLADRPGWLGLGYHHQPATAASKDGWLFVERLAPGGPSARAGVKPQDVVVAIDGKPLRFRTDADLFAALARIRPGQRVILGIRRGGTAVAVPVVAAAMTDEQYAMWRHNFELARARAAQK